MTGRRRRRKRVEEEQGGGGEGGGNGKAWVASDLVMSTVVTSKVTPLSHSTMKSLWEKGKVPMHWPSLPACTHKSHTGHTPQTSQTLVFT